MFLLAKRVPGGEKLGETAVFAGYKQPSISHKFCLLKHTKENSLK